MYFDKSGGVKLVLFILDCVGNTYMRTHIPIRGAFARACFWNNSLSFFNPEKKIIFG
jgi:hypothetical protein